jgi:predicted lipoprotein with Yx(FWY)xxD motif
MTKRTLGLMAALMLVLAACGTDDGGGSTTEATVDVATTADAGQEEPTTTAAGNDSSTTTAGMDGIHTEETDLGTILVDPEGFTLYIFTPDQDAVGTSVCNDDCAAAWPPVAADTPIGADLDASLFSAITRDDGSEQLAVNGMPLYLFANDAAPGDINGQGVNDVWFVVDPTGNMIEASASVEPVSDDSDDGKPTDYDY